MKKTLQKKVSTLFGIVVLVLISAPLAVIGLGSASEGYRLDGGTSSSFPLEFTIYNGDCYRGTNSSSNDYFIPTKSSSEWNSVNSNEPSGVNFSPCPASGNWTLIPNGENTYNDCVAYYNAIGTTCSSLGASQGGTCSPIGEECTDGPISGSGTSYYCPSLLCE